ncbi:unnamed protein product [Chrysoparadoxa australica]
MWSFGVLLLEMFTGHLCKLEGGKGESAPQMLEALKASGICSSGTIANHQTHQLPVMPEFISDILGQILDQSPNLRPNSMYLVTESIRKGLRQLVNEDAVLLPEGSLNVLQASYGETQDTEPDYGKVGRLHMWLGKALFFKGGEKRQQAIAEYREGVKVLQKSQADANSSSMALFRWYLGSGLLELGKKNASEAVEHLRAAVDIAPDQAKYRAWLALGLKESGDAPGAAKEMETAISLAPLEAEYHYQLGLMYRDCSNTTQAYAQLREAVALDISSNPLYLSALEGVSGRSQRQSYSNKLGKGQAQSAHSSRMFKAGDQIICGKGEKGIFTVEAFDNFGQTNWVLGEDYEVRRDGQLYHVTYIRFKDPAATTIKDIAHDASSIEMPLSEYPAVVQAIGRGALIGCHKHIAAVRQFRGDPLALTLVTSSASTCNATLEQLMQGPLYRGAPNQVAERMLILASQLAEAIAHCHERGVLLQDVKPSDVLASSTSCFLMLRPDLNHARAGESWNQAAQGIDTHKLPTSSTGAELRASYSFGTQMDYQSPEIFEYRQRQHEAEASIKGHSFDTSNLMQRTEHFKVTPKTSDNWAWALITLKMFADQLWDVGSGHEGLRTLELLTSRKAGVDSWDTEGVISWLKSEELWSTDVEREVRTFKITGKQLMIPTSRREMVEKLGLFVTRPNDAGRIWAAITGKLQRWVMPPGLVTVLRRCLADDPNDRFMSMNEIATALSSLLRPSHAPSRRKSSALCGGYPGAGTDLSQSNAEMAMVLNNAGVCLKEKGFTALAEQHYRMALKMDGKLIEAHSNLGLLYIDPRYDKFELAKASFMAAANVMGRQDKRHKATLEAAKSAERKAKYFQSQEIMQALGGGGTRCSQAGGERTPRSRTPIKRRMSCPDAYGVGQVGQVPLSPNPNKGRRATSISPRPISRARTPPPHGSISPKRR